MVEKIEEKVTKPLRVIDPKLYGYIVHELNDRHNIHSHDIEVLVVEEDSGLTITVKYGEDYAHAKEGFLVFETLKSRGKDLTTFIHEVADKCKEVMIAEYFKMMKP